MGLQYSRVLFRGKIIKLSDFVKREKKSLYVTFGELGTNFTAASIRNGGAREEG